MSPVSGPRAPKPDSPRSSPQALASVVASASPAPAFGASRPTGSEDVDTKSTSASDSSPRAADNCSALPAAPSARRALATAAASIGWSSATACADRRSRSRVTSATGTSSRTELNANICACSIRRGDAGGSGDVAAPAPATSGRLPRPITDASRPDSGS